MRWRLGVVGSPIEHSLSPQLHEAGLALAHLEGTSSRVELVESEAQNLRSLMGSQFDALSVTMPLKGAAARICDSLDDVAQRTDSVNSLLMRDGQLLGACTDGQGFIDAINFEFGVTVEGCHAVVLGAGGAARAIVDALVHAGVASVSLHGRTAANVQKLMDRYDNVFDHMHSAPVDLVVNTIPVSGRVDARGVLLGVRPTTIVVDIAYEPRMSQWRVVYASAGCRTANGLSMLAFQAARQMQWWWGCVIDGAALLQALE